MDYAKYISKNEIEYAPNNKGNILNYNIDSNNDMLLLDGYLPIVKSKQLGIYNYYIVDGYIIQSVKKDESNG